MLGAEGGQTSENDAHEVGSEPRVKMMNVKTGKFLSIPDNWFGDWHAETASSCGSERCNWLKLQKTPHDNVILIRTDWYPQSALHGDTLDFWGNQFQGASREVLHNTDGWWWWTPVAVSIQSNSTGEGQVMTFNAIATYKSAKACQDNFHNWDQCTLDFLYSNEEGVLSLITRKAPNCQPNVDSCTIDLPEGACWYWVKVGTALSKGEAVGVIISAGFIAAGLIIAVLGSGGAVAAAGPVLAEAGSSFVSCVSTESALAAVGKAGVSAGAAAGRWTARLVGGAIFGSGTFGFGVQGLAAALTHEVADNLFVSW